MGVRRQTGRQGHRGEKERKRLCRIRDSKTTYTPEICNRGNTPTYKCSASRRMSREGSIWLGLQGVQLGHGGSCGREANQAGGPPKERIADD